MKEIKITEIDDIARETEVLDLINMTTRTINKGLINMLDKYFPCIDIDVVALDNYKYLRAGTLYILKNNDKRILVV